MLCSGILCLPPLLLHSLVGSQRTERQQWLLSRQIVCKLNKNTINTTDIPLSATKLLGFLCHCRYMSGDLTHVVLLHFAQSHAMCIPVVTPVYVLALVFL